MRSGWGHGNWTVGAAILSVLRASLADRNFANQPNQAHAAIWTTLGVAPGETAARAKADEVARRKGGGARVAEIMRATGSSRASACRLVVAHTSAKA